jgi:hypothetical protein
MAASVSWKLWEVPVEMRERWKLANFRPKYQFVHRHTPSALHSVRLRWRAGGFDTVLGFEKEDDALQ